MAETRTGNRWLPPCILFLALLAVMQAFSVERQFQISLANVHRESVNEHQTRLRDHLQPETLARAALFDCVEGISALTSDTLPIVRRRLETCLASSGGALLLPAPPDPNQMPDHAEADYPVDIRKMISFGFNRRVAFNLTELHRLHWLQELHWGAASPLWYYLTDKTFSETFNGSLSWAHLFNLSHVNRIECDGQPGYLLTILFTPPSLVTPRILSSCNASTSWQLPPSYRLGSVLAFLPASQVQSPAWITSALRSGIPGLSYPIHVFDPDSTASSPVLSESLSAGLREAASVRDSGTIEGAESTACFQRLPIPGVKHLAVLLIPSPDQTISWRGMALGMGALFTFGLFLFAVAIELGLVRAWNAPLAHKAVLLFALAGVFPALGLSFSLQSLARWETILESPQEFRRLDERLETYENLHQQMIGEILANIRRFLAHPALRVDPPSIPHLSDLSIWLNDRLHQGLSFLISINSAHRQKGAYFFSDIHLLKEVRTAARARTIQLVQSLLAIMTETFRFRVEGNTQISVDAVRGGIFLDWLTVFLSKRHIHQLATNQDCLVELKFYGETVWYYLGVICDAAMEPRFFTLFNLGRKTIQRLECGRWMTPAIVGSASFTIPPSMVFLSNDNGQSVTFPDCATRFPAILEIMLRIGAEGGTRKHLLTIHGREYYAVARKLTGMDFVAMALQPRQTASRGTGWAVLEMVGPLLYPVLIIILALLLFRSFFLRPVVDLQTGVSAIAGGSLNVRLPVLTGDELGRLCVSFNHMADGLREKEFLSRFLSDLTLERVRSGAETRATRTSAAIMFSDIRGFTTLSEERPPEEVVSMLNDYLTLMESAIEEHGGSIDKFIGDAIMAIFLPALGREDPAIRAVRAGLAMRQALAWFNRERERQGTFTIQTGIGIASGEVLMGILGEGGRRDFTVTGPTVNLASTMEKRTKEASRSFIVVCPTTVGRLGERWSVVSLPETATSPSGSAFEISAGSAPPQDPRNTDSIRGRISRA